MLKYRLIYIKDSYVGFDKCTVCFGHVSIWLQDITRVLFRGDVEDSNSRLDFKSHIKV